MTFIFGSWTLGAALLFSAIKNMSLLQLAKGETGPGQPASIVDSTNAEHEAATPGTGAAIGKGGNVKPKGKLTKAQFAGHPSNVKKPVAALVATILKKFPGLVITATTDGTHAEGSYHYKGRAIDISGDSKTMFEAAAWIHQHFKYLLAEGIHNPNLSVKYHKDVPSSYWGSEVWGEHRNHIHVAV